MLIGITILFKQYITLVLIIVSETNYVWRKEQVLHGLCMNHEIIVISSLFSMRHFQSQLQYHAKHLMKYVYGRWIPPGVLQFRVKVGLGPNLVFHY